MESTEKSSDLLNELPDLKELFKDSPEAVEHLSDELVAKEMHKCISNMKENSIKVRILIIGVSGAGKSSLIQTIFPYLKDKITVGYGTPQTKWEAIEKGWTVPEKPVIIHDSQGFEVGKDYLTTKFTEWIAERSKDELQQQIHMVWYCIPLQPGRFQDYEKQTLKMLESSIPVIIVLTRRDLVSKEEEDKMKNIILDCQFQNISQVVVTRLMPPVGGAEICPYCKGDEIVFNKKTNISKCDSCQQVITISQYDGIEELIQCSLNTFTNKAIKYAFAKAQTFSVKYKCLAATPIIIGAWAGAAAIGANPIPFSDALLLIPLQSLMIISLGKIFDINFTLKSVASLGVTQILVTAVGITVSSFVGAGNASQAVIASSLTVALGITYTTTFAVAYKNQWHLLSEEELLKKLKENIDISQSVNRLLQSLKNRFSGGEDNETLIENVIMEELTKQNIVI